MRNIFRNCQEIYNDESRDTGSRVTAYILQGAFIMVLLGASATAIMVVLDTWGLFLPVSQLAALALYTLFLLFMDIYVPFRILRRGKGAGAVLFMSLFVVYLQGTFNFFLAGGLNSLYLIGMVAVAIVTLIALGGRKGRVVAICELIWVAVLCSVSQLYPQANAMVITHTTIAVNLQAVIEILTWPLFISSVMAFQSKLIEAGRRKTEEQNARLVILSERAEAAARAKQDFLVSMSHEIRTPLNAILGLNEMISRKTEDAAAVERYSESVRRAGEHLSSLINDILDYSKFEAGRMELVCEPYSLTSLLNDLLNLISPRAAEKGLELRVDVARDIPDKLMGSKRRIEQIVSNLLTNAVKYTDTGTVTLHVDWALRDKSNLDLIFRVEDTGMGIREEDQEKIFEAFHRVASVENRNIEGTGLGMAIVRRLLSQMSGAIDLKSVYGKGSVFTVTIPQQILDWRPAGGFDESFRRSRAQLGKYHESFTAPEARVLVVDDKTVNLTVVKGLLERTLVQVDAAQSGLECLELTRRNLYHVILMDHMMPVMDGVQAMRQIRSQENGLNRDTPVVAMTANAIEGAREEYLAEGFSNYLVKPIDSRVLEALVRDYLPEALVTACESPEESEDEAGEFAFVHINGAMGLRRCGSDPQKYLNILRVYLSSGAQDSGNLEYACSRNDWPAYALEVHALKSASATIGAEELSAAAREMELAARSENETYIKAHHGQMMELYARVLRELEDYLPVISPSAETENLGRLSEEKLEEELDALRSCLRDYLLKDAKEHIAALRPYGKETPGLSGLLATVGREVAGFNYDAAEQEILRFEKGERAI